MKQLRLRDTIDHVSEEAVESGSRLVPAKTIFVVVRGMILARVLPVALAEVPMAFNQDMKAVIARPGVDPEYLLYSLASRRQALLRHIGTSAHGTRRLGGSSLGTLELPIPPIAEQRAIAEILKRLEAAYTGAERHLRALRRLLATTRAKLLREGLRSEPLKQTEIGQIPESWKLVQLGAIAKIGNGSTPKRDNPDYWNGGTIPWLTSAKIHESLIETADEFISPMARAECHLPLVRKDSLVVAITGQGKTLGNVALVRFDTCVSQHLAYIQFETDEVVVPEFMLPFLETKYEELRQISQAGGSTRGALTCGFLKSYKVPIPSIQEQRQIANALATVVRRIRIEERRQRAIRALFDATLHVLVSGRVRVPQKIVVAAQRFGQVGSATNVRSVDEQTLYAIVREIVDAVAPDRVILFGSAARGEMGPNSDLDFLVVKSGMSPRQATRAVYRALYRDRVSLGVPVDVIVVTPEDVDRYRDLVGTIIKPAIAEGRVVYAT